MSLAWTTLATLCVFSAALLALLAIGRLTRADEFVIAGAMVAVLLACAFGSFRASAAEPHTRSTAHPQPCAPSVHGLSHALPCRNDRAFVMGAKCS